MKLNEDVVIYGRDVALIPYAEKHVTTRHKWLQDAGNRVDLTSKAPGLVEENANQKKLHADNDHCIFMISDVLLISEPTKRESETLIGEVHLILMPGRVAELQLMIIERSARRKALISETLLLILLFGAQALKLQTFIVILDENADPSKENRVMFAARPNEGNESPVPSRASTDWGPSDEKALAESMRKSSLNPAREAVVAKEKEKDKSSPVVARKSSISTSIKKMFKKEKTEYLCRLTRHLLKEDEGEHWPPELDFELTEPDRVELVMSPAAIRALQLWVGHAKRIKYSSMGGDGVLRRGCNTRIDGRTLSLIPYSAMHIKTVHRWMQSPDMYVGFGVQPPTLEQETKAHFLMSKDENCSAFIVCSKKRPEDDSCPVQMEGRAQLILIAPGIVQVHIGLVTSNLEQRTFMLRETLLLLLWYNRMVLPVSRVTMVAATAVRPVADAKGLYWNAKLDFSESPDGKALAINLTDNAVKIALAKLCRGVVIRSYVEEDIIYENGTTA